jgi:hypothetical protein
MALDRNSGHRLPGMWLHLPPEAFAALLARLAIGVDLGRRACGLFWESAMASPADPHLARPAEFFPPWPRGRLQTGAAQWAGAIAVSQGTDVRSVRRLWWLAGGA